MQLCDINTKKPHNLEQIQSNVESESMMFSSICIHHLLAIEKGANNKNPFIYRH